VPRKGKTQLSKGPRYCPWSCCIQLLPRWPVTLLSGILLGGAARWFAGTLSLGALDLALSLWAIFFLLGFLLSAIEATVFSAGRGPIRRSDIVGALLLNGILATVSGLLMATPTGTETTVLQQIDQGIRSLGWEQFTLRTAGAAIAYMVAYCVLGSIAWRFVRPYYTDPAHGLQLRVPSARIILPLQVGRGLIASLVLLPFVVGVSQGISWWCGLSVSLAVVTAIVPVLNARDWPPYLRFVHGVEISIFCFAQAASLWWLL
jgi:hypothetical protein